MAAQHLPVVMKNWLKRRFHYEHVIQILLRLNTIIV